MAFLDKLHRHSTQMCMQVQLATTCIHLRYHLARALIRSKECYALVKSKLTGQSHKQSSNSTNDTAKTRLLESQEESKHLEGMSYRIGRKCKQSD